MVSTAHMQNRNVLVLQREVQRMEINNGHIHLLWMCAVVLQFWIPVIIKDYKHLLGSAHLFNPSMSYYTSDMHYDCIWMRMILHFLEILAIVYQ